MNINLRIEKFKNKNIDFNSILLLEEYINDLLNDDYQPVLIININRILFDYCSEDKIIDIRLKNIIRTLFLINPNKIIFFTDRPFQYIPLTNKQLNNLELIKKQENQSDIKFNIYSTSKSDINYMNGYIDIFGTMKLVIENNRSIMFQPKSILIYISNDNTEFLELIELFKSFYFSFSLFKYLRTPISIFSYISNLFFTNQKYKIIKE